MSFKTPLSKSTFESNQPNTSESTVISHSNTKSKVSSKELIITSQESSEEGECSDWDTEEADTDEDDDGSSSSESFNGEKLIWKFNLRAFGETRESVKWREYFPHALQFLQNSTALDSSNRSDLCMAVGRCLRVDGRVGEAVMWLSECFLWRQRYFAKDHPARLASQHELARAYQADGQVGSIGSVYNGTVCSAGSIYIYFS